MRTVVLDMNYAAMMARGSAEFDAHLAKEIERAKAEFAVGKPYVRISL